MPRLIPLIMIAAAVYFWLKHRRDTSSKAASPERIAAARDAMAHRAVQLGFVPQDEIDAEHAGPQAPELTAALAAARAGDWEPAAALLASTGKDWELSSRYTTALSGVAVDDDTWLLAWEAARPDDPDAAVVRAESAIGLAWAARGGARAKDTTQEQFQGFHQLLLQAGTAVERAAELAGDDDPRPAAVGIWVMVGLGRPHDEMRGHFEEVTTRAPYLYPAHFSALQYWCQKWMGSVELGTEFAAEAAASAPLGSLFHAFPLICWFEHETFGHTSRGFRTPEVSALADALTADVAAADPGHPRLHEVRLLLAWYLVQLDRSEEALEQFRAVDGYAGAFPWNRFPDPAAKYAAARDLTVYKAA
ncbi:hypothetical protein ACFU5O_09145 [Streptomyces sp. NPDC057445]|uniref:hypothetical protein n=1 Tax=Streptomyces sp. NPDC057445 TaxID=3346136 RepID=UPI0036811CD4